MALLPCFTLDMLPMKHSSSAAASPVSSISSTIASPSSLSPAISSSIDLDDYPHGPIIKVILYHPSLLKIEADFPNVISVQEIPCNHFFNFKPTSTALGAELHLIPPDLIKNWQELLLVPLIWNSIHQICTILKIPDADAKAALITGILGQGATF